MTQSNGWRIALWVTMVLVTLWFFVQVRTILLPFIVAFIITVLLEPVIKNLRNRGWPKGVAVGTVFLGFISVVVIGIAGLGPMVSSQLGTLKDKVGGVADAVFVTKTSDNFFVRWNPVVQADPKLNDSWIDDALDHYKDSLENFGLPTTRHAFVEKYIEPRKDEIAGMAERFFGSFFGIASNVVSQLLTLLFVPLITLFLLKDLDNFKVRGIQYIPPSIRAATIGIIRDIGSVFISYLHGTATAVLMYMVVMSVALFLVGAPYAILLGILAGAVYLVPYINVLISTTTIFLLTGVSLRTGAWFYHFNSPWTFAAVVALVFLLCHFVYDSIVYQSMVGKSVGLHPVVSLFVTFSGAALFGVVGMIIAFPVAGAIKVILDRVIKETTKTQDRLLLPSIPLRHRRSAS